MIKRYGFDDLNILVQTNSSIIKKAFDSFAPQSIIESKRTFQKDKIGSRNARILIYLKKYYNIKICAGASLTDSFKLRMFQYPGIPRMVFQCKVYQYGDIQYKIFPGLAVIKLYSKLKKVIVIFFSASAVSRMFDIIFSHVFFNLLEDNGLFVLHASGVAKDGMAVVFPAASGNGKTTLATALLFSGFKWIGDDAVIFSSNTKRKISIFPVLDALRVDLDPGSLALFSLQKRYEYLKVNPIYMEISPYRSKQSFLLPSDSLKLSSRLKALVFPEIARRGASYIKKLKPKETAERLLFCEDLPNFCRTQNRRIAKYKYIFDLASNVESYLFSLGRDTENWSGIITSLIRKGYA